MINLYTNKIAQTRTASAQNSNQRGVINTATKPYANDCFVRSDKSKTEAQPSFRGATIVHNPREAAILKKIVEFKASIIKRLQEPSPFSDDMLELLGEKNARKPELSADHLGIAKAYLEYNPEDAMCQFHAHHSAIEAIKADPENHEAHFIYGKLEAEPDEAIEHLTEAINLNPLNTEYLQTRAQRHLLEGRRNESIEDYTTLTTILEPGNADLLAEKASVHLGFGEHELALKDFDEAIKLAPKNPDAHQGRGDALMYLQRYDDAAQSYETALKLNPQADEAHSIHTNLGSCHNVMENFPKAIEHFSEALSLAPDGDTYYKRGYAHLMLDNNEAAISDAKEALTQGVHSCSAIALQALGLSSLGKHAESRVLINKGKDAFPEFNFQKEIQQLALFRLGFRKSQRGA